MKEVFVTISILIVSILVTVFVSGASVIKKSTIYITGESAIMVLRECEKTIPRNQNCEIYAKPKEIEIDG